MRYYRWSFIVLLSRYVYVISSSVCSEATRRSMESRTANSSCQYNTERLARVTAKTGEPCSHITEATVQESLKLGQQVADCLNRRAQQLLRNGAFCKPGTANMGHFINNFANRRSRTRSQESNVLRHGTKIIQKHISESCRTTLTDASKFICNQGICVQSNQSQSAVNNCSFYDEYRTFDGSCNNIKNPAWGMANTILERLLPARYSDGVDTPPCSTSGKPLPSARDISRVLFHDYPVENPRFTLLAMEYGQLVAHDLALSPSAQVGSQGIDCCSPDGDSMLPPDLLHEECFPIEISPKDTFYSKYNQRCMNFVRSMTAPPHDGKLCPVNQMNSVTSWLDCSHTYGSDKNTSDSLRLFQGGRLRVSMHKGRQMLPQVDNPAQSCDIRSPSEPCYMSGDVRVNQNPEIVALQFMITREHNRLANKLAKINPHWKDECLFQQARRILIAQYQHILYNEWLPVFLGKDYMEKYKLNSQKQLYSTEYNPCINAATMNEFTAGAYRNFHSLVAGMIQLVSENRTVSRKIRMSDYFTRPVVVQDHLDSLVRGLCTQHMLEMDEYCDHELSRFLFRSTQPYGKDLMSIDIQRGRDHGLESYLEYRKFCGLQGAKHFQDLYGIMSEEYIDRMSILYETPQDIDMYVGCMAERKSGDSVIGPTMQCIIAEQFYRSRVGDRYFYDNKNQPLPFTEWQLFEIKKATMSRIICDNSDDIQFMQPRAFEKISKKNKLVPCDKLPRIDLSAWKENPGRSC